MNQPLSLKTYHKKDFNNWFGIACLLLLAGVYLSHLGFTPLESTNDEARRAIVSLEMMLSGDYLSPTINGEHYLNKPPLYNWIIILFFKLANSHSMFVFRLPVIVSVLLLGYVTYRFVKKYTNREIALLTAFTFMTNGRTLINDSLIGLIDSTFSLIIYLNFMLIFYFGEKKQYYKLFLSSYLLMAIAFLMKALPAVAFQGTTLLVYFIFFHDFRKLFHTAHFAGGFLCLLLLGGYYGIYFHHSGLTAAVVFDNLLHESTKRTVMEKGYLEGFWHFLRFPFELIYHFLPWSIFVLALFNKHFKTYLRENRFVRYNAFVFFFNIILYWTAPDVIARYLFMFISPLFTVIYYMLYRLPSDSWQWRVLSVTVLVVAGIMLAFSISSYFIPDCRLTAFAVAKSTLLLLAFAALFIVMLKQAQLRFYLFIPAVMVFRMAFNWFVLEHPSRLERPVKAAREGAEIAAITVKAPLYILRGADVGNFDGMSFHISDHRREILRIRPFDINQSAYYITDSALLHSIPGATVRLAFENGYGPPALYLVQYSSK